MFDLEVDLDNPADFDRGRERRGLAPLSAQVLELDQKRRAAQTQFQEAQAKRNELSRQIGQVKAKGGDASAVMAEVAALEGRDRGAPKRKTRRSAPSSTRCWRPSRTRRADDVPDGADESFNRVERTVGNVRNFAFKAKQHFELGEALGLMDFEGAAKLSGARFVVLKGALARLERALALFMLDIHTDRIRLHRSGAAFPGARRRAVWHRPAAEVRGRSVQDRREGLYLIPTSEVPLTNLAADEIIDEDKLPWRFTALTPCFRSEAGAAGKDTRGMIRQHQFMKVELVSIAHPDHSDEEHQRMTASAEKVLQKLGLPYRVITLEHRRHGVRRAEDL